MIHKNETLLCVEGLSVTFKRYDKGFTQYGMKVISDLSLEVQKGEILAVVGQSGSGKSLFAHALLGILPNNAIVDGKILYKNEMLTKKRIEELRGKEIALVPQSVTYLDPLMKIGKQVIGTDKKADKKAIKKVENKESLKTIFHRLGLQNEVKKQYPHQLSGGMSRRVLVSTAMISDASLIIADEPTPGMSVNQAIESLHIFKELANDGKSILLITHDIDLACQFADKIAVFYDGTILEITSAKNFTNGETRLRHPFTKALWKALPQNEFKQTFDFEQLKEEEERGCSFVGVCKIKTNQCLVEKPSMRKLRDGYVRCFYGN